MYVELFLFDNLLMDLLTIRLAAAMLSVRPCAARQLLWASIFAALAAIAAFRLPWLKSPLMRAPLLVLLSLALPAKGPKGLLYAVLATLFSTFATGGCALAVACLAGGGMGNGSITGGLPLRAALIIASAAAFLPGAARRLLRRRIRGECTARLVLVHKGLVRSFTAVIDTGNALREPVSGLPVAIINCRALERGATLPIPVVTPAGRAVLMGFLPEKLSVDGREFHCIVALTRQKLPAEAILPPEAGGPV